MIRREEEIYIRLVLEMQARTDVQTEVIPASAPASNRVGVSSSLLPYEVSHCEGESVKALKR